MGEYIKKYVSGSHQKEGYIMYLKLRKKGDAELHQQLDQDLIKRLDGIGKKTKGRVAYSIQEHKDIYGPLFHYP